jgi:ketosteroid isomerase-like protein
MPVTLVACLLLLLQASPAPNARAKAEEQVRAAVIGANLAYAKNDLPVYWTFYAPDLTQWWPTGRVDLPTYKKQWEKFIKDGGRIEQADVQDLVIQLGPSNDSAVASYRLTVTTREPDGKATTEVMQETDVLFKRLGAWKVVHLHYAPAPARKE